MFFWGAAGASRDGLDAEPRGFSPVIARGVARRCSYGYPQVLLCAAERGNRPFPTTFWLVCPHLTKLAGRLESQNGVLKIEESLSDREDLWRKYHRAHALLRLFMISGARRKFLMIHRPRMYDALRRGGVGGIEYGSAASRRTTAKCVHLQLASYMGFGAHPASDWLEGNIASWECGEELCSARASWPEAEQRWQF
ncbi:MAG: DUF501 domain-containing protein [Synergistaceae bacterium]|jgi:hypothetical protein|nr:DUF501 domain-containing protein [Synergistaceae bacterium]